MMVTNEGGTAMEEDLKIEDVIKTIIILHGRWGSLFKDNVLKRKFERELLDAKEHLGRCKDVLDAMMIKYINYVESRRDRDWQDQGEK